MPPATTLVLSVRVRPQAGRSEILGRRADGTLEVALRAAPEGGKANAELLRLLAKVLRVPPGNLTILRGATSRAKIVRVLDADPGRAATLGSVASASPAPKRQK